MILAGGRGSRIGYDKKKLLLNGKTVIDSLIEKLHGIFDEIIVSSNTEFKRDYVTALPDDIGKGPLAGIYQGLRRCKSDYLYIIACDMPFVSPAYIAFMKDSLETAAPQKYDACLAQSGSFLEPFNAFWGKSCIAPVRTALENGSYKILDALKKLNLLVIESGEAGRFPGDAGGDIFFNINYASDLQTARNFSVSARKGHFDGQGRL